MVKVLQYERFMYANCYRLDLRSNVAIRNTDLPSTAEELWQCNNYFH